MEAPLGRAVQLGAPLQATHDPQQRDWPIVQAPRPGSASSNLPAARSLRHSASAVFQPRRVKVPANIATDLRPPALPGVRRSSRRAPNAMTDSPPQPQSRQFRRSSSAEPPLNRHIDFSSPSHEEHNAALAASPEHNSYASHESLQQSSPSSAPPSKLDPAEIIQLMHTSAGSFRGRLLFRNKANDRWRLIHGEITAARGDFRHDPHSKNSDPFVLMSDLRGCRAHVVVDPIDRQRSILIRPQNSAKTLFIRPDDNRMFQSWYAVLLAWSCVGPKQSLKPSGLGDSFWPVAVPTNGCVKFPSASSTSNQMTIKSGNAMLIDGTMACDRAEGFITTKVLLAIRSQGSLSVRTFDTREVVNTVNIAKLPRSAVQRLHRSAFDREYVIAIYPQYSSRRASQRLRPLQLAFESKKNFESWFVLLRAIAEPEFYGSERIQPPMQSPFADTLPGLDTRSPSSQYPAVFRLEHTMNLRVVRVKLSPSDQTNYTAEKRPSFVAPDEVARYSVEVCVDEHVKARTPPVPIKSDMAWNSKFTFDTLSSRVSTVTLRLKKTVLSRTTDFPESLEGEVTVDLNDLLLTENFTGSLPLINERGIVIGEIHLELRHNKEAILLEQEYDDMSKLLQDHGRHLTVHIAKHLSTSHLNDLAEYFLNIFQVSGQADKWLMSLIEHELGGPRGVPDSRPSSAEANMQPHNQTHGSYDPPNSPTQPRFDTDAVLLFRGNTLLTKALDLYMKRNARSFLVDALGDKVKELVVSTESYEVDPNRLPSGHNTRDSWRRLIDLTSELWMLIRNSVSSCPPGLAAIFRHVRMCTRRRFGDGAPAVDYTSVSSFLFLRFYCAAILSPQLFGLVDENTQITAQAQRALVLVAKSLQGLANLSTFGNKEPWMAPMNAFCSGNRDLFKKYIDAICDITHNDADAWNSDKRMSIGDYATFQVVDNLHEFSREGFPSYPDLLDGPRNLARLANLWLLHGEELVEKPRSANRPGRASIHSSFAHDQEGIDNLVLFNSVCNVLQRRLQDFINRAQRADERIEPSITLKWALTAERIEMCPEAFWLSSTASRTLTDLKEQQPVDTPPRESRFGSIVSAPNNAAMASAVTLPVPAKPKSFLSFGWDQHSRPEKKDKKDVQPVTTSEPQSPLSLSRHSSTPSSESTATGRKKSTATTSSSSNRRKKSPPRPAEQNAMRKLGLI